MGGWAAIVQRVRDGEQLDRSITQAATRLDLMLMRLGPRQGGVRTLLKPFTYRGRQCKYLWMMGWPALTMPGWAPCYANLGDEFVFAINPLQLKGYIDFVEDKAPTILENAEFQELMKGVPAAASSISYGRLTEVIVAMYNTAAPVLMMFQGFAGPMGLETAPDLANLPSSGLVRRYAQGAVTYGVFEKGTYRIECLGNGAEFLGPHLVPVGITAGAAAIVLPAFARARNQAERVRDRNNLNQIARGMAVYLNEHGDNRFYPKSMAELVEKGVLPREVLVSPLDRAPPMLNGIPCSYVSCFERHAGRVFLDDFPPNVMMAWDRISFGGDGFRNVLFFDSHVEWVPQARFQQLLNQLDARAQNLEKREPQKGGEL
jgi:prepilin-type processing-associated H-X9-DG protein